MFQILAFIKFLIYSTNQHGVHSPFVYNLLTKCLYKKDEKPGFDIIRSYRKTMLQDERVIEVKDFGAGSRVFKSNSRRVSQIAKNAGISKKRAFLLNRLTSYLNIKSALELGTSVGISSAAIAVGNPVKLITLEGCPETGRIAQEFLDSFGLDNVSLKIGSFEEILKSPPTPEGGAHPPRHPEEGKFDPQTTDNPQLTTANTFDLIYFDGNHQKDTTLKYFYKLLPLADNDSVFIFDDIHWSKGMEEAWEEIKANPKVKVSIDSFFWGIVFFRKEQEKEHFILRL